MGDLGHGLFTLPRLVGAAERVKAFATGRIGEDQIVHAVEALKDRLASEPFVAFPLQGFHLSSGGKDRLVSRPHLQDHILHEALIPVLERTFNPMFRDCSHGYRKGRSTRTAVLAAKDCLNEGSCNVLHADIASFYPSIDRNRLLDIMKRHMPGETVGMIKSLIEAPVIVNNEPLVSKNGLPLGLPLSPILSNIYLMTVDDEMTGHPFRYLRYADDILIMAESIDSLDAACVRLTTALARTGLCLSDQKTSKETYTGVPIVWLGHPFTAEAVYARIPAPGRRPRQVDSDEHAGLQKGSVTERAQTLYIIEDGVYLRIDNQCIVARKGQETIAEVPIHRVDRVLVLTHASFSSGFVSACIGHGIPVLFFVGKGRAYGSLIAGSTPNPLRLRAQYALSADPARKIALARDILGAKMGAMARRLRTVSGSREVRDAIERAASSIATSTGITEMIGHEGVATRAYYEVFATRIKPPGFAFVRRSKRPPRDPINSLMSFSYALLFAEMQTALLARGLDPHPGVLHELHRNHQALASDLIEPYRPLIADSFVLLLVNSGRVDAAKFDTNPGGAVYMNRETRQTVLEEYERFMTTPAGGRGIAGGGGPRTLVQRASHAMLAVVLGDADLLDLPLSEGDHDQQASGSQDCDSL